MFGWALVVALGCVAGVLTTVAGMGGGLILVLALSLRWGPAPALAATAVALFVGNVHRTYLFRRSVARNEYVAFVAGAAPGALLGALFAVSVPPRAVHAAMAIVTAFAVLRALGKLDFRLRPSHLAPGGAIVGLLTGAAGGAGVLAGPLFLAAGLAGRPYVATMASVAATMHLFRIVGYGTGGVFTLELLVRALVLAATIVFGNLLGQRLRRWTERAPPQSIETVTLVVCVTLAAIGLVRGAGNTDL